MNIALFATGPVGYEIAKFLAEVNQPLSCLVLDSDDKRGWNKNIVDVLNISETKNVIESRFLYDPTTLDRLKKMNLDLGILAWWPYILKGELLNISRMGCLNFHPSYLPYNRGKDPNFWSIVEDVPFGVTLQFIDKGVDSGHIAFQKMIPKDWEDTGASLYEKATKEIVSLFKNNFHLIVSGNIPRKKQNQELGSFHKRSELNSASHIDLDAHYKARDILNILRARTFPPHPAAWFMEDGAKYEVRVEIKKVDE